MIGQDLCYSQLPLVDGMEWHYNLFKFWEPGLQFNRCWIEGDTIIQQKSCKVYHRQQTTCDYRPLVEYIHQDSNRIFYFDFESEEFNILYDYSLEVGDTLEIPYWEGFNFPDSVFHIRVDSIDYVQFGQLDLKRFYVSYDSFDDSSIEFWELDYKRVIIEGIGSLHNFFHFDDNGLCDGYYNIGLRCFGDGQGESIMFEEIACDSVLILNQIEVGKQKSLIQVSPNPFQSYISIESNLPASEYCVEIYSMDGVKALSVLLDNQNHLSMDLTSLSLSNGVYIIVIRDFSSGQVVHSEQLLKIEN